MRFTKAILIAAILLPMSAQCRADEGGAAPAAPAAPGAAAAEPAPAPGPHRATEIRGGGGGGFSGGVSVSTGGDGRVEVIAPNAFGWGTTDIRLDRPTIITTQAIDQAQCREELNVMSKLVRDQLVSVTGESTAMGIPIKLLDSAPTMYIENCGAVISATVNAPFLAAKDAADNKDAKAAVPGSAWQRAKDEIDARRGDGRMSVRKGKGALPAVNPDDLVDAIVKILPEASNMRTLKPDENVIVTIGGMNDAGSPFRLTLKAKKSDIDDAAVGKISADEFKQRVAHRVG